MEKFILSHNGKEVKVGDTLIYTFKECNPYCRTSNTLKFTVLKEDIPNLIKAEIIKPITLKEDCGPVNLEYFIERIAKRVGMKPAKVLNHINAINEILPAAAFSIILKEIAIHLDKKYNDHISKSPTIYVVSLLDGNITKVNKSSIKSYMNFAAFRSYEDAKTACDITRDILNSLFEGGEQ